MTTPKTVETSLAAVSPSADTVAAAPAPAADELPAGSKIARYQILRRLGAGGMGVVYAARDAELARDVALKLLRADRGGNAALELRLQREAQAMARLAHDNVVTVFDVGTHDGQVFLAMALIEGTTVAEWLEAAPRSWREIVDRYRDAGRGLAAAHAAGIVHRDFKPGNMMIDRRGRVRVTDFGLARASDAAPDEPVRSGDLLDDRVTREGALVGTPRYMAPEQLARGEATERSDQFAFAVALFEGIAGTPPYRGATPSEILAAIRAGKIAPARMPGWLRRVLVRALAADPERRFRSMDALLAALDRGRRRPAKIAVASGVIGLAAASATLAIVLGGTRDPSAACDRAADRVDAAWTPGQRHRLLDQAPQLRPTFGARTAERVAGELDRYAERLRVQRIAACRATVDDTPARGIDAACLDDQLDSLAAVAHALADPPSAEVLDRADQVAATLVDCAHRPASAITPPRIDQRAAVATIAGAFAEAEVQGHRGDYAGALGKLRPVIAQARALGYPPSLGRVLAAAGHLELALGDAHAEADLREAAEVAAGARDDQTAVRAWIDLLALAGKQGDRPDRYETTLVAARAAAARSGDPDERAALDLEHGRAMNQASKFADADASCRQALELAGKLHGEGSLDVRPALACLGKAAEGRGDYAQSRQWLDRALAIDRAILGDQHPDTADDLQVECELLLRTGKFDEGLAACRAALAVREHVFGAQSDQVARTEKTIGDVLVDGGHTTDALPHLQRAIDIAEHNHGPEAPALASALASLGSADHDLGKAEPAVALFRRAIAIYEKTGDESDLGITLINLTDVLITMKHYPDALASAQRAQAALEHSMGASSPIVGFALYDVARCQTALGRPADAIPPLERAISLTDPNSNDPDNLASYQFALAQALWDSHGDRARARELARTSFATLTEIGDAVKGPRAEVGAWLATHR